MREPGGREVLEREMGCSRAEFMRWLPGAARHAGACPGEEPLALAVGGGTVRIALEERPARRLGRVALPVLAVRFTFDGLAPPERAAFLARFDAYTHRGGG